MRGFHIALLHHSVMKGGVNLFMSQQFLHLFDRHPFVNGGCGHGPPEFMRVNVMNVTLFTHLLQHDLDSARQQAFMRITNRYEQCRVPVCPGVKVFPQMKFCSCVKIDNPFLIALAENDASRIFSITFGTFSLYSRYCLSSFGS